MALYQLFRLCTSEREEKIILDSERRGKGGSGKVVAGGNAAAIVWKG
jgi:hypothetical protein